MLPIPKHLTNFLVPVGEDNNEFNVKGLIKCTCGNESFKINLYADLEASYLKVRKYENDYALVIYVTCAECQKEYLLFDKSKHGWNGFVCDDGVAVPKNILEEYFCKNCDSQSHSLELTISSQGKEDFIEESDDEFDEDDWVEAFEFIEINTKCSECDCYTKEWVSYETM